MNIEQSLETRKYNNNFTGIWCRFLYTQTKSAPSLHFEKLKFHTNIRVTLHHTPTPCYLF